MKKIRLLFLYIKRLGFQNVFDYLFQRFIQKKEVLLLKVPALKYKVAIRNNSSDIPLFTNIFILEEYNVSNENQVSTIIDCGANVGLASLYFLSKFPNATIIAVEPEIHNYLMLKRNLDNYKNCYCIDKGGLG